MSQSQSERLNSVSHDRRSIAETVNTFVETVTDALADTQADTEAIDAVEEAGSDVADAVEEEIQHRDDEIQELQDELKEAKTHAGRGRAELSKRVSDVEDTIDDMAATDSREAVSSDSEPRGSDHETTALERICALPEHVVEDNLTRNQQRARSVAQLVKEIGKSVPAGVAITSSRIRRALSAREDTTIHRQTVKRVADFLKRFGDGGVKIKETRGGKTTVVFDEELANDVTGVVMDEGRGGVTPLVI